MSESIFEEVYNKRICDIASENGHITPVFNPVVIVEGSGNNCGDKLLYRIKVYDNKIVIDPEFNACMLTKASLNILLSQVNNCSLDEVKKLNTKAENLLYSSLKCDELEDLWLLCKEVKTRMSCIELPWKLLKASLLEIDNLEKGVKEPSYSVGEKSFLACESCVTSCAIKPIEHNKKEKKESLLIKVFKDIFDLDLRYKENSSYYVKGKRICSISPYRFGKCVLDKSELNNLKKLLQKWDDNYFSTIFREAGIQLMVALHISKNFRSLEPVVVTDFINSRKRYHNKVNDIWEKIDKKLNDSNVSFIVIKGFTMNKFYDEAFVERDYRDIDILVPNLETFYKLASILKYEFGFEFYGKLGQAGSLKELNCGSLSGHGHMIKYMDAKDSLIIDISFPNIPYDNNRLLQCSLKYNNITDNQSDLFMIALIHSFKHTRPPVNDINDCYVMIKKNLIDWEYIDSKVSINKLKFKMQMIFRVLEKYYQLDIKNIVPKEVYECSTLSKIIQHIFLSMGWPYTRKSNKLFLLYNKVILKKNSQLMKMKHMMNFTKINTENSNETEDYKRVCINSLTKFIKNSKGNRIYVVPIISFIHRYDLNELMNKIKNINDIEVNQICPNVYSVLYHDIFLVINECYIGAFSQQFKVDGLIPNRWISVCELLLSKMEIKNSNYYVRLQYNADSGLWIYV